MSPPPTARPRAEHCPTSPASPPPAPPARCGRKRGEGGTGRRTRDATNSSAWLGSGALGAGRGEAGQGRGAPGGQSAVSRLAWPAPDASVWSASACSLCDKPFNNPSSVISQQSAGECSESAMRLHLRSKVLILHIRWHVGPGTSCSQVEAWRCAARFGGKRGSGR